MYKQYKKRGYQIKEMEEGQIRNKYLHAAVIKLKNILKKIDVDVDIPTQNYFHFFKWIVKKALWAAILLLFSVLTTIGCMDLLSQYINGVTTTTIDVNKDRNVPFPSSTVCLPLYGIDFSKLDENFNIENASQYLHAEVSEYFENQYYDKETFLNGSFWSPAMLLVVYNYVSHLHFIENNEWLTDTERNFSEYQIELQNKDWWEAACTLETEISMSNISISELTEAVGQAIAIKFNLEITYYTTYDGQMHPSYYNYKTRFVGSSWICYNANFSDLVITSQDETIVLKFNTVSLKIVLNDTLLDNKRYMILFAPSADFYMDLKILASDNSDSQPLLIKKNYSRRKNYYLQDIGSDAYIIYDVIQVYRFMPIINGQQQCSEVRSMEECRTQCRASMIKNLCNCTATALTTLEDIKGECTLTSYRNCSIYDANNDSMCDCLKPCTRWDYEIKETGTYNPHSDYYGSITIRVAKFDYRIFEQTYLWKMEGFIGAFGGALSLWLGIDFFMAINFFSLVVAKLIKMITKSKQPSSSIAVIIHEHSYSKKQNKEQKGNQAVRRKETERRTANDELLAIKAIKPSNWSWFSVLSFIVNIIFSLATVILCIVLFQKYFSDPPVIEMSIPYDEAFELPKSTEIILPMYSVDLELDINKTLYEKKVDDYFGQYQINKEAFLSSSAAWPPEIFALCYKYLTYLSAVEGTDLDYLDTMNFSDQALSRNYYFFWSIYPDEWYYAAFQMEKKLSQMKVTIKELKLSVAEKLKAAFQLSVTYVYAVGSVVTKENVSIIENTCISEYRMCFKADFSNKPIRTLGDYIEISTKINHSILPMIGNLPSLKVDFYGRIMKEFYDVYDDVVKMAGEFGFSTTFKVFTIDAYRKIPLVKEETKCMNYEKRDQCRWQCRSEMIYKKCNCTAMSLPLPSLPLGPECSFSIYNTCLQYTKQDDMRCINHCLKPCEKRKYEVDMEKRIPLKKNEAKIQIQVKKFDYAVYVEKLPWKYDTFASAIGGALGLWLGLDFVILIDVISELIGYILARLLQTVGLKKMNASPTVPEQVQTNGASKKHQEESDELYFTSAITTWWKKSFKMLIKALYSMKLGDILKLSVVKSFWGYLVVVFCFLTFRMCLLSTKQYLKNPITTKMQFLLNDTFIMPTSTLCVPVSQLSLLDMLGFGEKTNYKSMMMEYFAQNQDNKEVFLNAINKKWPLYMYSVIYKYLSAFNRAEAYIMESGYLFPIDLTSSHLRSYYIPLWENEWKAIFKLETVLKRMNVSRSELLQSFGQQTLKIYDISILHIAEEEKEHNQSNIIEISETSSVDFNLGACFRINFSGAALRSEAELFNISIDSNGLHSNNISDGIYFDMNGNYRPDNKFDESIFVDFGYMEIYIVGAKEVDQIFPGRKEDPDCDEYVSPKICRMECHARLIIRLCNCTTASLPIREVSNLSEECTLTTYQSCLKYYAADDFECRKNCLRSCRRESYRWKLDNWFSTANNKINLILRVEEFGYAVFEEEYEWTFEGFLGEFGGNLSLWMGLDIKMVLGEIFSIVFVIGKQLIAFFRAKIAGNAVIVI